MDLFFFVALLGDGMAAFFYFALIGFVLCVVRCALFCFCENLCSATFSASTFPIGMVSQPAFLFQNLELIPTLRQNCPVRMIDDMRPTEYIKSYSRDDHIR